jgi:predicted neutral ceramidase superfamily lipid hydrolase
MNDWKVIILHILYFIFLALKTMLSLLIKYIMPFLLLVFLLTIIAIKLQWQRQSILIFMSITFVLLLIGPALLHKIITKEFNKLLIIFPLYVSIQTVSILAIVFRKVL